MLITPVAEPLLEVIPTPEYLCGVLLTYKQDSHANFRMPTQLLMMQ
jgi:hypothetical protein